jgi:hypothetical protein
MKTRSTLLLAAIAIALMGANLISQNAAMMSAALTQLKLEAIPGPPGLVGAPPKFKVTRKTIEYLEKLEKTGAIVQVENNGSVKIVEASSKASSPSAP